jgi:hypothetical protein
MYTRAQDVKAGNIITVYGETREVTGVERLPDLDGSGMVRVTFTGGRWFNIIDTWPLQVENGGE